MRDMLQTPGDELSFQASGRSDRLGPGWGPPSQSIVPRQGRSA